MRRRSTRGGSIPRRIYNYLADIGMLMVILAVAIYVWLPYVLTSVGDDEEE